MKKEKPKAAGTTTHDHTLFFDKLINLIPPKFYLPSSGDADDDNNEKPYFHTLTVPEKAAQKKRSKENLKKAREIRLDPRKPYSTTVDLLDRRLKKSHQNDDNDNNNDDRAGSGGDGGDGGDGNDVGGGSVGGGTGGGDGGCDGDGGGGEGKGRGAKRSATYEELRMRLRRRIEEFRSARNAPEKGEDGGGAEREDTEEEEEEREDAAEEEEREDAAEVAARGLRFGKMKVGREERRKGRKESKKAKLERLEKGREDGDEWEVAGRRAAGEKVHDNPKLLKKSMDKERRRKEKSGKKWAERAEAVEALRKKRQKRRKDNIAQRIQEKRRRKIERREKKLMRPGSSKGLVS